MISVPPSLYAGPCVGSRWRHARNKRSAVVIGVYMFGVVKYVEFKYVRGIGDGVGWRRGVSTAQQMELSQWRSFFQERVA